MIVRPFLILLLAPLPLVSPGGPGQKGSAMTTTKPVHTNRLANATSPYLLQHAHNPVDWYEWGPEALKKARDEQKPIFLSIGYAACHWCHVMAHESFENEATAEIMNRHFVNVKVDREERPDLDEIYMQATMLLNRGQGGWPMSVWLTPELQPFFAGTYFPPEQRFGRPGFPDICERIGTLWGSDDRAKLVEQSERLTEAVRESLVSKPAPDATITVAAIDDLAQKLANAFDSRFGGVSGGGTNKFPPSMAMDIMLRAARRRPADDPARKRMEEMVRLTLTQMAYGGIYDHLAGGIARYSTDVEWHAPHFEKMLYDQALVSRSYLDGFVYFDDPLFAATARSIFDYVLADLQSPAGGLYSTRDADSEGEEGKYYVWTQPEILDVLGPELGPLFCDYYDVREGGNWDDPHAPGARKNILHIRKPPAEVAKAHGLTPAALQQRLAEGRSKLVEVRAKRVPPGLDDKVLAEWNGLMIASLARGGAVLNEPKYVEAAARAADFVLTRQYVDGRLLRSWRAGRTLDQAFLSDYAAMIEGLLELYEATFDSRWLTNAVALADKTIELFADTDAGGFYFTSSDHERLITRTKDLRDAAVPSGNSVMLLNLLRLHVMTGEERFRQQAERSMRVFAGEVLASPWSSERYLAAADFALTGPVEVAIVGSRQKRETQALLDAVANTYLPNRVLMGLDPASPESAVKSPLLTDRKQINGQPSAYVCRNYTCKKPVNTVDELRAQLAAE